MDNDVFQQLDETFQSAPLTKARGDATSSSITASQTGFNPLPSQKQGETVQKGYKVLVNEVSIRSPHKSKGRRFSRMMEDEDNAVSIRSPHKSKGRPLHLKRLGGLDMFQSAPLTKARGDMGADAGDQDDSRFNPLPSQKQGETISWGCGPHTGPVSIRSPHKSKGRLVCTSEPTPLPRFQSAPLTKARGDIRWSYGRNIPCCFNPLPSQKQGETSLRLFSMRLI